MTARRPGRPAGLAWPALALALLLALAVGAAGCRSEACDAPLAPLTELPAWVMLTADNTRAAVLLLDAAGEPVADPWIDSGTVWMGQGTPLSTASRLPFASSPGALELLLGDPQQSFARFTLEVDGGGFQREIRSLDLAGLSADRGGAIGDLLELGDGSAILSRGPASAGADRGNNLLVADLDTGLTLFTIELAELDGRTPLGALAEAAPYRFALAGQVLVVGLDRTRGEEAAEGGVALVSVPDRRAVFFPVTGLSRCREPVAMPRAADADPADPFLVAVLCAGAPSEVEDQRRGDAGVALLSIPASGGLTASIEATWRASSVGGPVPSRSLVPLAEGWVAAIAGGSLERGLSDRLLAIEIAGSRSIQLMERFYDPLLGRGLGVMALDSAQSELLVPDIVGGVRRFDLSGLSDTDPAISEVPEPYGSGACLRLPARAILPFFPLE